MAERRMFAKSVVCSGRFLRMPATSRLLYYDLGMEADDDGAVEAFGVMRKTGATEDDLAVLVSKGFVKMLNKDLVAYILDWGTNNQIRRDRYHESIYKDLISASCDVILLDGDVPTEDLPAVDPVVTEVVAGNDTLKNKDKKINKRGKEKKVDAFSEFAGDNSELFDALNDFEKMRKSIKKPMTDRAKQMLVNKLQREFSPSVWIPVLEQSIRNCWLDVWPLKDNQSKVAKNTAMDDLRAIHAMFEAEEM